MASGTIDLQVENIETLTTGMTLIREGRLRVLSLKNIGADDAMAVTIPSEDRPQSQVMGTIMRAVNGKNCCTGEILVSSNGVIELLMLIKYNVDDYGFATATNGVSGQVIWMV